MGLYRFNGGGDQLPPGHRQIISRSQPSLDEFKAIAAKAFRQLPQKFHALREDLVIRVEDFPTDEVVHGMKAKTKFQILGLFRALIERQ